MISTEEDQEEMSFINRTDLVDRVYEHSRQVSRQSLDKAVKFIKAKPNLDHEIEFAVNNYETICQKVKEHEAREEVKKLREIKYSTKHHKTVSDQDKYQTLPVKGYNIRQLQMGN